MNNATSPAIQQPADFQLSEVIAMIGASLRNLHRHPVLAWLTPELPVRLVAADRSESLWVGERRLEASAVALRSARFTAVEVPADLALARDLVLPPMSDADLRDAVALDVRDSNPFDASDLVWGYRSKPGEPGLVNVKMVLASRTQVTRHLQAAMPEMSPSLEVWVMADDGAPVVLRGFGEAARARRAARGRLLAYALMLGCVLLATAIAVTPTVQLHIRATQAAASYQALQKRAGPAMAQREALVRGREDLANLQEVMADHVEPLVAIEMLTRLIPDDTWLRRVQAQGARFTLSGETPNAAALMNTLSSNPGLRDVRAPSPATRSAGSTRESFVVEFTVEPELLRRPAVAASPQPAITAPLPAAPASGAALLPASAPAGARP